MALKLNAAIARAIWEQLGFPGGYGAYQPDIADVIHFVVPLPNGITQEALVAERAGAPGYTAARFSAAVAAQNSFVRLLSPLAGNRVVLLDQILLWGGVFGSETFTLRVGSAVAGAGAAAMPSKRVGAVAGAAETYTGASAAVGGTVIAQFQTNNLLQGTPFPDAFEIPAGADLHVTCETVNFGFGVTLLTRELPS